MSRRFSPRSELPLRLFFVLTLLGAPLAGCGDDGGGGDDDDDDDDDVVDAGPEDGGVPEPRCVDLRSRALSTEPPPAGAVDHTFAPDAFDGALVAPRATTTWWMNLVVGSRARPTAVAPYMIRTFDDRLSVAAPNLIRQAVLILSPHIDDLSMGATESISGRVVTDYDDLSVTQRWDGPGSAFMEAPIVRGMPYATMFYEALTPRLSSTHPILTIDGTDTDSATGTRFVIGLGNGATWIVYASEEITLSRNDGALVASGPLTGHLRIAVAGDDDAGVLDAHAGAIPTGGTVDFTVCRERPDVADSSFTFERQGEGPLLMLGLPHHRTLLVEPGEAAITRETIRGEMFGVVGDTWNLELPLATTTFEAPRPIAAERVEAVRESLVADQGLRRAQADTYFGGKEVARSARLAAIADELGEDTIATSIRDDLADDMGPWLDGDMEALSYDRTWGGIIAAGAEGNPDTAFGQGFYNDHHFHYGYWIYAAAVLAREDSAWRDEHRDAVDALVRDIANPSPEDPHFTTFRTFDWYAGHSWASGFFEFFDARNQESTSEAVNAWYAVALWGEVTDRPWLRDLGRMMAAAEIQAAQLYWQIPEDSEIYRDTEFAENRVVGVLWGGKVEYATFFGSNTEFIHCIQMLPFTPLSEALLPASWIEDEYPVLSTALTRKNPVLFTEWRGFIYLAHAIIDKDAAWDEVQTLDVFDNGNSRTNSLYWVATRP